MQANRDLIPARAPRDLSRWVICVGLALAAHAAGAAALITPWGKPYGEVASAPVIVVELAAVAVAPQTERTDVAPGPQQTAASVQQVAPEPQREPEELTTAALPAPQIEATPAPLPEAKARTARQSAPTTTVPSPAERRARRAAAPASGAPAQSNALPSWRSALVARLERNKRYPSDAGGVRGVAVLAFNIDRSGGVHNARIAKSSGSAALDRETLALAARAQPLPPPPAELSGAQIPVSVPLRYNMD